MKKLLIFLLLLSSFFTVYSSDSENINEFPIPKKYTSVVYLSDSLAMVNLGGKWIKSHEYPQYVEGGKWFVINSKKEKISSKTYDEVYPMLADGLLNVFKNGKWGFINSKGEEIVAPIYDEMQLFFDFYVTAKLNGKYGVVDTLGNAVLPFEYDDVPDKIDGKFAIVQKEGIYGIVDFSGNEIFPFIYDHIDYADSNNVFVVQNGKTGILNINGDVIIPVNYESVESLFDMKAGRKLYIKVEQNGLYGIISPDNQEIIPIKYSDINWVEDNFAGVKKHGKWTIYNFDKKKELSFFLYDKVSPFYNGFASVNVGGSMGIIFGGGKNGKIDTLGNVVIPITYESIGEYSEGLIPVSKEQKWGYINIKNELVIPYKFYHARPFVEGLAPVAINNQIDIDEYKDYLYRWGATYGYINKNGEVVIPIIYKEAMSFHNGQAWVQCYEEECPDIEMPWGIIDRTGKQIEPFRFSGFIIENYLDEVIFFD